MAADILTDRSHVVVFKRYCLHFGNNFRLLRAVQSARYVNCQIKITESMFNSIPVICCA